MTYFITAQFDGNVIVPDEPLNLPPGRRIRVQIEPEEEAGYPLTRIGELATDMGVSDLAAQHQQYARRQPACE